MEFPICRNRKAYETCWQFSSLLYFDDRCENEDRLLGVTLNFIRQFIGNLWKLSCFQFSFEVLFVFRVIQQSLETSRIAHNSPFEVLQRTRNVRRLSNYFNWFSDAWLQQVSNTAIYPLALLIGQFLQLTRSSTLFTLLPLIFPGNISRFHAQQQVYWGWSQYSIALFSFETFA